MVARVNRNDQGTSGYLSTFVGMAALTKDRDPSDSCSAAVTAVLD